jgi:hypothetical protein
MSYSLLQLGLASAGTEMGDSVKTGRTHFYLSGAQVDTCGSKLQTTWLKM